MYFRFKTAEILAVTQYVRDLEHEMKNNIRILMAVIAFSYVSCALAKDSGLYIHGIGSVSCATWLSNTANEQEGTVWLMGFWTGMSYGSGDISVGSLTDTLGIIASVKASCALDPAELLSIHAMVVFNKFRSLGR